MMDKAIRWSGSFLILGSYLFGMAIVAVSLNLAGNGSKSLLFDISLMLSSILLVLSIPGMYFIQAREAGWLGLAGYLLLQIGILLPLVAVSPHLRFPTYNPPGGDNPVDGLLALALALGLLLTGLATIRAGFFPRWAGILLLGSTAGFFFAFFISENLPGPVGQVVNILFSILLMLGFAWIGVDMINKGFSQQAIEPVKGSPPPVRSH